MIIQEKKNSDCNIIKKYLSNFWRTLEMFLINSEINLILTWSEDCVISSGTWKTKFRIRDTKIYVPIVTLSSQDNAKLLEQLKFVFKKTINQNKNQNNPFLYELAIEHITFNGGNKPNKSNRSGIKHPPTILDI